MTSGPSGLQSRATGVVEAAAVVEPATPDANGEEEQNEEDAPIVLGELEIRRNASHGRL